MSASEPKNCPQCGKPLLADAPGGLCPNCVMAMNLAPETQLNTADSAATASAPLSPKEMTERFPNFEITECLGRGGMGVVYKARQKALDREVAIKVLAGEWQDDPQFAERFEREAKTLAQMSHPSIVTVHDFGEVDGLYYLVMEYVDGVNLRDLLTDGKMAPEQALAIVPPICEALQYAHGKGVVHRDIKPENLLLDRNGRVKIADFGIASLVGTTAEVSGTPSYMAPEQLAGSVDRRADIYALGVVLYEMLTGERPGKDVVAPSRKVEVDVKIDEMVLRALEKEPERRYQTALEFQTTAEMLATCATENNGIVSADFRCTESSSEFTPSYRLTGFATAGTFFYVGIVLSMLLLDLTSFNRHSAYLLAVGLMLVVAPFVGVGASNTLRRAYSSGDPEQRRSVAAWLKAGSLVAGLLALPAIGFAMFFLRALATEQGGWHPVASEFVLVSLTWAGAVLLPICSICLWLVGRDAAGDSVSSNVRSVEKSLWSRRIFWLLASLVITAPLVVAALVLAPQAARHGIGNAEALLWLTGAAVLAVLALLPPIKAVLTLRRTDWDAQNPWPRRIVLLLCAVPAALLGLFVLVMIPAWLASRTDSPTSPDGPLTTPQPVPSFGAEREVVLVELEAEGDGPRFLDIDSGRTRAMTDRERTSDAEIVDWMAEEGLDLCADKIGQKWALAARKLKLVRIPPEQLSGIAVDDLLAVLERADPGLKVDDEANADGGIGYYLPDPLPADLAVAFRTAEGAIGVMRIDEVMGGPPSLKIRYKSVIQEAQSSHDAAEQASAKPPPLAFQGRWLWEEEKSGDEVWLNIPKDGPVRMHGTDLGGQVRFHRMFDWKVQDEMLVVAAGQDTMTGELTNKGGSLRMETTKDARKVVFERTDQIPPALETDLVIIEDLALQMIVAIREQDDQKLKSLAVDRIKRWPDALPVFAVELRERYRQLVGDGEFDLRATESLVKSDLGVVRCTGPEVLKGKCLMLYFAKTQQGWKNCLLGNSTEDVEIREHLSEIERQIDAAESNGSGEAKSDG